MPTWLITDNAVVTARDATTIRDLAETYPDTALALSLDVIDQVQVTNGVNQAEERFGSVDVIVNNAGYGYRAAVEEGEENAVAQLFATNFFGPIAMIKAVHAALGATLRRLREGGCGPFGARPRSGIEPAARGPSSTLSRRGGAVLRALVRISPR